jgi:two-component system, NtrC family, nitrogen regulation response regulator NtrX
VTTEQLTVAINIDQPLRDARVEFERAFLVAVLRKHAGNITHTAQAIEMERAAFHRKLRQLGIRVTIERVLRITSPIEGIE